MRTLTSKPKVLDFSYEWEELEAETDPRKPDLAVEPGMQRAVWDLNWEGAARIPGAKLDAGNPKQGPRALPGSYTVRLTADGQSMTQPLTIEQDPRVTAPPEALQQQLAFALGIRDDITRLTGIVTRLQSLAGQLQARSDALKSDAKAGELLKASAALRTRVPGARGEAAQPAGGGRATTSWRRRAGRSSTRGCSPLLDWATQGDCAPTQGLRDVYTAQHQELEQYAAEFEALLSKDLAALNAQAASLGFGFVQ